MCKNVDFEGMNLWIFGQRFFYEKYFGGVAMWSEENYFKYANIKCVSGTFNYQVQNMI